jgi:hypothetical protein
MPLLCHALGLASRTDAGQHFGHQTCEHFHLVCASRHFSSGAWGCGPPNPLRRAGLWGARPLLDRLPHELYSAPDRSGLAGLLIGDGIELLIATALAIRLLGLGVV